jgi:O-antigen/teichoic acid export membrane protein
MLVTGLDSVIIGYFDYKSLAYYTLATSLTSFAIGIQNSIFTTILPNAAAIGARGDRARLGKLLISTTRYAAIILVVTSLPLILGAKWILFFWVGSSYAVHTVQLLQLLVAANFVRQLGAPYSIVAMAVGEQKVIILSPLIEGVVNIIISIILTSKLGVNGVAIGTIVGGVVSVSLHFFYNLQRTKSILIENAFVLVTAIAKPLISVLPGAIYLVLFVDRQTIEPNFLELFSLCAVVISTIGLLYFFAIDNDERTKLSLLLKSRLKGFS